MTIKSKQRDAKIKNQAQKIYNKNYDWTKSLQKKQHQYAYTANQVKRTNNVDQDAQDIIKEQYPKSAIWKNVFDKKLDAIAAQITVLKNSINPALTTCSTTAYIDKCNDDSKLLLNFLANAYTKSGKALVNSLDAQKLTVSDLSLGGFKLVEATAGSGNPISSLFTDTATAKAINKIPINNKDKIGDLVVNATGDFAGSVVAGVSSKLNDIVVAAENLENALNTVKSAANPITGATVGAILTNLPIPDGTTIGANIIDDASSALVAYEATISAIAKEYNVTSPPTNAAQILADLAAQATDKFNILIKDATSGSFIANAAANAKDALNNLSASINEALKSSSAINVVSTPSDILLSNTVSGSTLTYSNAPSDVIDAVTKALNDYKAFADAVIKKDADSKISGLAKTASASFAAIPPISDLPIISDYVGTVSQTLNNITDDFASIATLAGDGCTLQDCIVSTTPAVNVVNINDNAITVSLDISGAIKGNFNDSLAYWLSYTTDFGANGVATAFGTGTYASGNACSNASGIYNQICNDETAMSQPNVGILLGAISTMSDNYTKAGAAITAVKGVAGDGCAPKPCIAGATPSSIALSSNTVKVDAKTAFSASTIIGAFNTFKSTGGFADAENVLNGCNELIGYAGNDTILNPIVGGGSTASSIIDPVQAFMRTFNLYVSSTNACLGKTTKIDCLGIEATAIWKELSKSDQQAQLFITLLSNYLPTMLVTTPDTGETTIAAAVNSVIPNAIDFVNSNIPISRDGIDVCYNTTIDSSSTIAKAIETLAGIATSCPKFADESDSSDPQYAKFLAAAHAFLGDAFFGSLAGTVIDNAKFTDDYVNAAAQGIKNGNPVLIRKLVQMWKDGTIDTNGQIILDSDNKPTRSGSIDFAKSYELLAKNTCGLLMNQKLGGDSEKCMNVYYSFGAGIQKIATNGACNKSVLDDDCVKELAEVSISLYGGSDAFDSNGICHLNTDEAQAHIQWDVPIINDGI